MFKATYIEDINRYSTKLPCGDYLIDGIPFVHTKQLEPVIFESMIQTVTTTKFIQYYYDGSDILTVEEYEEALKKLISSTLYETNLYHKDLVFDNIDDEYAYKKFKQRWKPIYNTVQTISEPLLFEVSNVKIDTGNPFIVSMFENGFDHDVNVYEYNRPSALMSIIKNTFDNLEMEFISNLGYEQTKHKMVWSNSTHSNFEYVVAFGTYIFTKSKWISLPKRRDTDLQFLKDLYEADKNEIENYITDKFTAHFGKFNVEDFDYKKHLDSLQRILNDINNLVVKKTHINERRFIITALTDRINEFKKLFKY